MTVGAIIQARMSSGRLPGKVLMPLAGKPVLQYVVEAAKHTPSLAGIVVATSTEPSDDVIAAWCAMQQVACYRGSLDNVAERFLGALGESGWAGAVRLSADSPLLNWQLIEEAIAQFKSGQWDVVTNVFPRSFPHGQSVEVVSAAAFRKAYPKFYAPEEFEHVTPYFYAHAPEWRISNILTAPDQSHMSLAVDTADDLARLEQLVKEKEAV